MFGFQRTARVICTVLVEAAAVVSLVAIGRAPGLAVPVRHLGPWLRDGDPATVMMSLLRWVALVGATWLLVSTLLYVVASMTRVPAAVRAVRWSTLPAVRRAVDAACAVSVAAAVVLAPTGAGAAQASDPPSVSLVRDGRGIDDGLAGLPPDTTRPAPSTAPPTTTVGVTATSTSTRTVAPAAAEAASTEEV